MTESRALVAGRRILLENSGLFQFGQTSRGGGMGGFGGDGGGGGGGRQNNVGSEILFFSRRIGLSAAGEAIPILGGTRLTGRVGAFTIGAMNIQQKKRGNTPSTNFTALRLRRDLLANSDIGVMVLNKDSSGPHYNRVVGADANFRFHGKLDVIAHAAKSFSPEAVVGGRGNDVVGRAGFNYRAQTWNAWASHTTIGARFNDEMGFIPRTGIRKTEAYASRQFRPKQTYGWLREISPHWLLVNVDRIGRGLESRYVGWTSRRPGRGTHPTRTTELRHREH